MLEVLKRAGIVLFVWLSLFCVLHLVFVAVRVALYTSGVGFE